MTTLDGIFRRVRAETLGAWKTVFYAARNRLSRSPVTGTAPVVVSLTTYGARFRNVHLVVESIGHGTAKPQRILLWLDEGQFSLARPSVLSRLERRGLEVRLAQDLGPHKKWFGVVNGRNEHDDFPLVTADDDVFYARDWLRALVDAHVREPNSVVAHRVRRLSLDGTDLAPYSTWRMAPSGSRSFANFSTGVGGTLYPPAVLAALAKGGLTFLTCAPRADDVWLHATSLRAGVPTRHVLGRGTSIIVPVRGARGGGLFDANVGGGGNDDQIRATYAARDRHELAHALEEPDDH